jgi:hypothetical protein
VLVHGVAFDVRVTLDFVSTDGDADIYFLKFLSHTPFKEIPYMCKIVRCVTVSTNPATRPNPVPFCSCPSVALCK